MYNMFAGAFICLGLVLLGGEIRVAAVIIANALERLSRGQEAALSTRTGEESAERVADAG